MRIENYQQNKTTYFIIEITEEGIVIFVNDEHSLKTYFPIEATEEENYYYFIFKTFKN